MGNSSGQLSLANRNFSGGTGGGRVETGSPLGPVPRLPRKGARAAPLPPRISRAPGPASPLSYSPPVGRGGHKRSPAVAPRTVFFGGGKEGRRILWRGAAPAKGRASAPAADVAGPRRGARMSAPVHPPFLPLFGGGGGAIKGSQLSFMAPPRERAVRASRARRRESRRRHRSDPSLSRWRHRRAGPP